ncbi:MAG TPA: alpha/beta hydrolase [Rhizomicrobium sp.]|jgi:pimeloyl-ACP methyl ester carboxylesterase
MRKFLFILFVLAAAIGGTLYYFSSPDIPRAQLLAKYAVVPSQFINLADGARVHVRDRGPRTAPALVLLHGSNASLFTWEPWVRRLDDSFRVVTIDLQGHGLTGAVPSRDYSERAMVRLVAEIAGRLGLTRFAIGGNSMGGAVAARFAEEYPERVTQLILIDAAGMKSKQGDRIPLAFRLARIPVLNQILLHVTPRALVVEGLDDAVVRKVIIDDAMIDRYWDFARMEGTREATLERFNLPQDDFVGSHAARIAVPTLILWGEEDHLLPVEAARSWARAIKSARLIVYPATGHLPQEEMADKSAADVRTFLLATSRP